MMHTFYIPALVLVLGAKVSWQHVKLHSDLQEKDINLNTRC